MHTPNSEETQDVWPIDPPSGWVWGPRIQYFSGASGVWLTEKETGNCAYGRGKTLALACTDALTLADILYGALTPKLTTPPDDLPATLAELSAFLEAQGMPKAAKIVTRAKDALTRQRADFDPANR